MKTYERRKPASPAVEWSIVSVFVLLVAAGRFALSFHSLWHDELASIYFALQPLSRLWSAWMSRETNPPLYYSVLHIWSGLFGYDAFALRFASVLAGLLAMLIQYSIVRSAYGVKAALLTLIISGLSVQQLVYSLQVRAYIFVYLAVAVSMYGLLTAVRSSNFSKLGWLLYLTGAVAASYLHTTAVIWPFSVSLALIVVDRRYVPFTGSRWLHIAIADALLILCSSWWLYVTWLQIQTTNHNISWMEKLSWRDASPIYATLMIADFASKWQKVLPLFITFLVIIGVLATWQRWETRLVLATLVIAILTFIAVSLKQQVLLSRTIIWLPMLTAVIASAGLARLKGSLLITAVVVLIALMGRNYVSAARTLQNEDWISPVATLIGTPHSLLIVGSESMDIAVNMVCLSAFHQLPCPFPVLIVAKDDDDYDSWARDSAYPSPLRSADGVNIASDTKIYILERIYHDVLGSIHELGLLMQVGGNFMTLVGPIAPSLWQDLEKRGHWEANRFVLN